MDLSVKSEENIHFMIEAIKKKLQLVNQDIIKSDSFSLEHYEDLHDIYSLVKRQPSFSIREMEAILDELRNMRK